MASNRGCGCLAPCRPPCRAGGGAALAAAEPGSLCGGRHHGTGHTSRCRSTAPCAWVAASRSKRGHSAGAGPCVKGPPSCPSNPSRSAAPLSQTVCTLILSASHCPSAPSASLLAEDRPENEIAPDTTYAKAARLGLNGKHRVQAARRTSPGLWLPWRPSKPGAPSGDLSQPAQAVQSVAAPYNPVQLSPPPSPKTVVGVGRHPTVPSGQGCILLCFYHLADSTV